MAIGYQKITRFAELVNKSRIYDVDSRESAAHYKSLSDKKGKVTVFMSVQVLAQMFQVWQTRHKANECRVGSNVTYYNYGEQRHIYTRSDKTKNEQAKGNVLFSGSETATDDRLIQGTCFINGTPLNLVLFDIRGCMVINIIAMCSMTTSFFCLNCPLSIFGRYFRIDLVCLPLDKLDVILGMKWLEYNRFYINSFNKMIIFPEIGVEEVFFLSAKQVDKFVQDGGVLFMLLATLAICEN
ncbi:uncharacterized protein LOC131631093 [Vicia villosa]|uniref:uncharacterized protein LOC131631093 n=1 Tax=Vicia villosa TaxID=3911 RepID=UPI00273CDA18|nr:uncharacterized protein LOC131631093 [Vicia villosa]